MKSYCGGVGGKLERQGRLELVGARGQVDGKFNLVGQRRGVWGENGGDRHCRRVTRRHVKGVAGAVMGATVSLLLFLSAVCRRMEQ